MPQSSPVATTTQADTCATKETPDHCPNRITETITAQDVSKVTTQDEAIVTETDVEKTVDSNTWHTLLDTELDVVARCLQHNPKSYGAWHHRVWILRQKTARTTPEIEAKAWASELELCNLFLTKDERNCECKY